MCVIFLFMNFVRLKLYTIKGLNPPTTVESDVEWRELKLIPYNLKLDWSSRWAEIKSQTSCTCKFDFIYLGVEDANGDVLLRNDLNKPEYLNGHITTLDASFESYTPPKTLILWPHQKEGEWLTSIKISL